MLWDSSVDPESDTEPRTLSWEPPPKLPAFSSIQVFADAGIFLPENSPYSHVCEAVAVVVFCSARLCLALKLSAPRCTTVGGQVLDVDLQKMHLLYFSMGKKVSLALVRGMDRERIVYLMAKSVHS